MGNAFGWIKKPFESIINLFEDFANLILSILKIGRDFILGAISSAKVLVEIMLDAFDLIFKITELIQYLAKLISEYLHIPFIFVYLTPFFLLILLTINFIEKIISF